MAGRKSPPKQEEQPANVKVFNCPSCGSSITLRAVGETIIAVCSACESVIDTSDENYKIISRASKATKRSKLVLPLGRRGKLRGVLWEVIGYVERQAGNTDFYWREYLLFNPTKGFRWLTETNGHWNYVVTMKDAPRKDPLSRGISGSRVSTNYLGKTYYLFNRGPAKITYIVGEFYWRAQIEETVQTEDYVCPPEILSCEKNATEVTWSLGNYIAAEEVQQAFQIEDLMPFQFGVAPNQPSKTAGAVDDIKTLWGLFAGILLALQIGFMATSSGRVAYTNTFTHIGQEKDKIQVSPQFELAKNIANVEVEVATNVDNDWFEVQGELVNDEDGESYEFEKGVEYYHGYDSDGSWSEGGQVSNVVVSAIPGGKYHLNIQGANSQDSSAMPKSIPYRVTIRRDVATWSNFLWALLLISVFPAIVTWRHRRFEAERWSESDFNPYAIEES